MKIRKRLVGLLAMLLGVVGVAACLAGLVGTWVVRARLDTTIAGIVERVDGVLSTLEERTGQANRRIGDTRDSARRLNERVQQRVAQWRDVPADEAPDLDEIERQLYSRIQLGRDWIGFVQSGVDLAEQFVEMLNSTSIFVQQESKTPRDVVAAVRGGRQEIQEAFELVEEVRTHLEGIRDHQDLDANARQIESLSSRIDSSLKNVHQFGKDLEAAIAQMGTDVANLGNRIRRQILIFAVIANLILVWLAVAQVSLAIHGWRLLRSRS